MELLLTGLFWLVVGLGILIAAPFVISLVLFLLALLTMLSMLFVFGCAAGVIVLIEYLRIWSSPIVRWFKRTAGCK